MYSTWYRTKADQCYLSGVSYRRDDTYDETIHSEIFAREQTINERRYYTARALAVDL
jgi:hypothetical protein